MRLRRPPARAVVVNYTPVAGLMKTGGRVVGAQVVDARTGREIEVRARAAVNATGIWADRARFLDEPNARPMLRPTKGIHLLISRDRLPTRHAVIFTSPRSAATCSSSPGRTSPSLGTTDTDYPGDLDNPAADPGDGVPAGGRQPPLPRAPASARRTSSAPLPDCAPWWPRRATLGGLPDPRHRGESFGTGDHHRRQTDHRPPHGRRVDRPGPEAAGRNGRPGPVRMPDPGAPGGRADRGGGNGDVGRAGGPPPGGDLRRRCPLDSGAI